MLGGSRWLENCFSPLYIHAFFCYCFLPPFLSFPPPLPVSLFSIFLFSASFLSFTLPLPRASAHQVDPEARVVALMPVLNGDTPETMRAVLAALA